MQQVIERQVNISYNPGMELPANIDFAALCKELRSSGKWTQQEMADKLGVQLRTYKRYEAGEREPTAQIAFRLCAMWHEVKEKLPAKKS